MNDKERDLCVYRIQDAVDTLEAARLCFQNSFYKDTINRCYYAAFYAVKAVLAMESVDFKRHKDAVGYFNHNYVATGIFSRELGRKLGMLKRKRENSDYDDFFVASREEAQGQLEMAEAIVKEIKAYLEAQGI